MLKLKLSKQTMIDFEVGRCDGKLKTDPVDSCELVTSPRHTRHTGTSQGVTTRHVSSSTSSQGLMSRAATRTRPYPATLSILFGGTSAITHSQSQSCKWAERVGPVSEITLTLWHCEWVTEESSQMSRLQSSLIMHSSSPSLSLPKAVLQCWGKESKYNK